MVGGSSLVLVLFLEFVGSVIEGACYRHVEKSHGKEKPIIPTWKKGPMHLSAFRACNLEISGIAMISSIGIGVDLTKHGPSRNLSKYTQHGF